MVIFVGLNLIKKCRNIRIFNVNFGNIVPSTKNESFSISSSVCCEKVKIGEMSSNDLFNAVTDRFQGVIVKAEEEFNCDVQRFEFKLKYSVRKWIDDGIKTVWFHILLRHSKFIPILTDNDFVFHRVNDVSGETLVMCRWLPKNKPCTIPPYSHTMVGVGGIVVNDKNELLVVYQSYGTYETWKLPGGYVDPHEDLPVAVIREVEEETGIKTAFKSCVLFRHTHHANFDCSDLYFITTLEPLTDEVNEDSEEVIKVKWMTFEEFLDHPRVHELNKIFIRTYLQQQKDNVAILKHDGLHPVTKKPYTLYCATLNKSS